MQMSGSKVAASHWDATVREGQRLLTNVDVESALAEAQAARSAGMNFNKRLGRENLSLMAFQ